MFCGQKTYNGVAILARGDAARRAARHPGLRRRPEAPDRRRLSATCAWSASTCRTASRSSPTSTPTSCAGSRRSRAGSQDELATHPRLAVLGDFNIAPEDRDVHDPKRWEGGIHVSAAGARGVPQRCSTSGFADAFRLFEQPEKEFSWWDYRMNAFQRGWGLRIDHVLLSPALASAAGASIDKAPRALERPSDHAPVIAELSARSVDQAGRPAASGTRRTVVGGDAPRRACARLVVLAARLPDGLHLGELLGEQLAEQLHASPCGRRRARPSASGSTARSASARSRRWRRPPSG